MPHGSLTGFDDIPSKPSEKNLPCLNTREAVSLPRTKIKDLICDIAFSYAKRQNTSMWHIIIPVSSADFIHQIKGGLMNTIPIEELRKLTTT